MRFVALTCLLTTIPLCAQSYYVPGNTPTVGTSNVIPFGSTTLASSFANAKMQTKATVADLGALPGMITGLGFAPSASGRSHFDTIEIVMDHHPAGAVLSTTFANNLTANAVTVLSATNYHWNVTANVWNEIGLQNYFVYNGVDDLIVQVTLSNSTSPSGFRRDTRPRLYWNATTGTAPATGTLTNTATKFEIGMVMARVSSNGISCPGSNGTPANSTAGIPQPGNVINFNGSNGLPNGFGFLVLGLYNGAPFPMELSTFGMPNCFQFTDVAALQFLLLDGAGAASVPFGVPVSTAYLGLRMYSQFAFVDPTANAAGITTTNYNRILIGN